ncbi:hypothetical protein [Rhodosalinus halophilus]|nr:hypothetical protein [Rhodosalinus halophilus]
MGSIEGFPRGRTTEQLLALLAVDFDPLRRAAVVAELGELARQGAIRRGRDGRWRATAQSRAVQEGPPEPAESGATGPSSTWRI